MEKSDLLKELVLTQFKLRALMDDYCRLASKIENLSETQIHVRINDHAQEYLEQFKSSSQEKQNQQG